VRRAAIGALGALLALAGCAAPYDDDGDGAVQAGRLVAARAPAATATPVVVDTDLGGDDLVALAFLLRHPEVDVRAVTVAGTGLVGCEPGVDIVVDLFTALGEPMVPIACGREQAGPGGATFPQEWRDVAATGTGIPRANTALSADALPAAELIGRLAAEAEGLVVVALGPMTNLADLAATPAYRRLAGIHAMGGSVAGPLVDGVAEWNAAADPAAFETVLAADVPLTVVPEDAIPTGTPDLLATTPVVGAVAAAIDYPAWWDLATAAALVAGTPDVEPGQWALDAAEPGRLVRSGDGAVDVVRSLDPTALEAAYGVAFG
jgi:hypothetical protein